MPKSYTGRNRVRKTSRSVLIADLVSRILISAGGVGTILAVTGVFVFLVMVVLPLFSGARVHAAEDGRADLAAASQPLALALGEHKLLGWRLFESGQLEAFRLDDGSVRERRELFPPGTLSTVSIPLEGTLFAFGTKDGSVQLARLEFQSDFLEPEAVDAEVRARLESAKLGDVFDYRDGVILRTPRGQYRYQSLQVDMIRSSRIAEGPIRILDHVELSEGPLLLAATDTGGDEPSQRVVAVQCRLKNDFFTGGKTYAFDEPVVLEGGADGPPPDFLALSGTGRDFYLAWKNGRFVRLRTSGALADTFLAGRGRLVPVGKELTSLGFVLGQNTLVWGDSSGELEAGFPVRLADLEDRRALLSEPASEDTVYGLVAVKSLRESGSAPTVIASSRRSRVVAAGFEDGSIEMYNVTTQARLAKFTVPGNEPIRNVVMSPKDDGLLVVAEKQTHLYDVDLKHPEAALGALFGRVWYEGYGGPRHTWQSSSGHTGFEPKLGLIPLVVGTVKATLYSMLFGAPLAILAAIFSSEFLARRTKAVVKPTIELMASLPSVVLGFLAAQVIAPFVDDALAGSLAMIVAVPLAFALMAYLFQLLPSDRMNRLARHRILFFLPSLAVGVLLAVLIGPLLEGILFSGDLEAWLSYAGRSGEERYASSFGGWVLLLLPLSALIVLLASHRFLTPWVRTRSERWSRAGTARFEVGRFALTVLAIVLLAFLSAGVLGAFGFDPRGRLEFWGIDYSPMGAYSQRNSLIVGFVMGFAIIPIIYTLADDALTAVPNHLRSASLGAGATPWQTAMRIVLPTATSGIFSALMVGLGRAVGETMIVLMATGNTPILEFNGFSGFRTLAANIAYEIPEAVRDSTHYRTLFMAALVLFVMTFIVNTCAEAVRLRFRKRAQLL